MGPGATDLTVRGAVTLQLSHDYVRRVRQYMEDDNPLTRITQGTGRAMQGPWPLGENKYLNVYESAAQCDG
jgi:hypothetical protein